MARAKETEKRKNDMQIIKAVIVNNYLYYKLPEGMNTIGEFIEYLNKNYNSFVELWQFIEEGCSAPYFIEEELKTEKQYVNVATIHRVAEGVVTVLSRCEYEERLRKIVSEKCIHCQNYVDDGCTDLGSYFEKINLDGYCPGFEKR